MGVRRSRPPPATHCWKAARSGRTAADRKRITQLAAIGEMVTTGTLGPKRLPYLESGAHAGPRCIGHHQVGLGRHLDQVQEGGSGLLVLVIYGVRMQLVGVHDLGRRVVAPDGSGDGLAVGLILDEAILS